MDRLQAQTTLQNGLIVFILFAISVAAIIRGYRKNIWIGIAMTLIPGAGLTFFFYEVMGQRTRKEI